MKAAMRWRAGMLMAQLSWLAHTGNGAPPGANYFPLWRDGKTNAIDMALIYQGGVHRPQWATNRFAPYVTFRDTQAGKEEWLFDTFLFIEFKDGKGHAYAADSGKNPAGKSEWQFLLDRNFAANDGIPMLEKTCEAARSRIGSPLRKRKVAITLPEPVFAKTNWGELNGRALDFNKADDQISACEWFMDTAEEKWRELAPRNLDLAGFYWLDETAPTNAEFIQAVARRVHARGKQFYWIPFWQPSHWKGQWQSYGFDIAWQQPNHFFHPELPDSRLRDACYFADSHGMGLEMEFDPRMISQPNIFMPRFEAYFKAFDQFGVSQNASMAWYEGGVAIYELATSENPELRARYNSIGKFVLRRQHIADEKFAKER